jgi:hypothetical protein
VPARLLALHLQSPQAAEALQFTLTCIHLCLLKAVHVAQSPCSPVHFEDRKQGLASAVLFDPHHCNRSFKIVTIVNKQRWGNYLGDWAWSSCWACSVGSGINRVVTHLINLSRLCSLPVVLQQHGVVVTRSFARHSSTHSAAGVSLGLVSCMYSNFYSPLNFSQFHFCTILCLNPMLGSGRISSSRSSMQAAWQAARAAVLAHCMGLDIRAAAAQQHSRHPHTHRS